jgi:parvulin-like peptidyl-prolyl isomerase
LVAIACITGGCGDDTEDVATAPSIPADAVAVVDGEPVPRALFDDVLALLLAADATGKLVHDAYPDASACADRLMARGKPVRTMEGEKLTTPEEMRTHCEQLYRRLEEHAMRDVIVFTRAQKLAAERGIHLSKADRRRAVAAANQPALKQALRRSGVSRARFEQFALLTALETKIQEALADEVGGPMGRRALRTYYDDHRDRFQAPESRRVRFVVTKTEREAETARVDLERGASWGSVVREHATDGTSRDLRGRAVEIAAGTQEEAVDELVFGAEVGEIAGPVEISTGWLVVQVESVSPARPQTFREAEGAVANALAEERNRRIDEARSELTQEWRARTRCVEELAISLCANGPEPETTTAAVDASTP